MRPLSAAAKCSWVKFILAILHLLGQPAGRLSVRQLFRKDFCFLLPRRQLPPQLLLGLRMLLLHRGNHTCRRDIVSNIRHAAASRGQRRGSGNMSNSCDA